MQIGKTSCSTLPLSSSWKQQKPTASSGQLLNASAIARNFEKREEATTNVDGHGPEELITGGDNGGGIYVDLTATREDGSVVRVLLIETLADAETPTARESRAAARIRARRPDDELRLIPKLRR